MITDGNPSLIHCTFSNPIRYQPIYPRNHPWYLVMANIELVTNKFTTASNND